VLPAWHRRRRLGRELADRFPVPPPPWSEDYWPRHVELVSFLLDRPDAPALFARGTRLPRRYGIGFDERVVEYPWLWSRPLGGRVLDAGATLNHAHVLERFRRRVDELHVVTLAAEPQLEGVSYTSADLRELPFEDASFDTVVSLSTLEHVGMDASTYGVDAPRAADPDHELRLALAELRRVLAPGGRLLATVPYGAREDHGWFRQLDQGGVESLISAARPARTRVDVYRYSRDGWQTSSLTEAAGERYHDHHADRTVPPDRAAAARAVACLRLDLA
jgi:SAM-dependent methyltransferase